MQIDILSAFERIAVVLDTNLFEVTPTVYVESMRNSKIGIYLEHSRTINAHNLFPRLPISIKLRASVDFLRPYIERHLPQPTISVLIYLHQEVRVTIAAIWRIGINTLTLIDAICEQCVEIGRFLPWIDSQRSNLLSSNPMRIGLIRRVCIGIRLSIRQGLCNIGLSRCTDGFLHIFRNIFAGSVLELASGDRVQPSDAISRISSDITI